MSKTDYRRYQCADFMNHEGTKSTKLKKLGDPGYCNDFKDQHDAFDQRINYHFLRALRVLRG